MRKVWAITFGGKAGHTDYIDADRADTAIEAEAIWRRENPALRFLPVKVKKTKLEDKK